MDSDNSVSEIKSKKQSTNVVPAQVEKELEYFDDGPRGDTSRMQGASISTSYFTRSRGKVNDNESTFFASQLEKPSSSQEISDEIKTGFLSVGHELTASITHVLQQSLAQMTEEIISGIKQSQRLNQTSVRHGNMSRPRFEQNQSNNSDTETDSNAASAENSTHGTLHSTRRRQSTCKLPPFTGKEKWKVWLGRFEQIAQRKQWSDNEKLDELLPRLQGPAGEFAFTQLSNETRSTYKLLVKELNSRFQLIELPKTFRVKLSHRAQKHDESVEDYATDLKRLYDKAFPERSADIRQVDLLQYFLNGLYDDKARQQVEFIKEPQTIDDAVRDVVTFQESKTSTEKGRKSKNINLVRPDDIDDEDDDESVEQDSEKVCRMPTRGSNNQKVAETNNQQNGNSTANALTQIQTDLTKIKTEMVTSTQFLNLQAEVKEINGRVSTLEQKMTNKQKSMGRTSKAPNSFNKQECRCLRCGNFGHFAIECPFAQLMTGHMQVAVNPNQLSQSDKQNLAAKDERMQVGVNYTANPTGQSQAQVFGPEGAIQQPTLNNQGSSL